MAQAIQESPVADQEDGCVFSVSSTSEESKYVYKMDHKKRGCFIIINNKTFDPVTGMGDKSGIDADVANLKQRFNELGFNIKICSNLNKANMLKVMKEVSKDDNSDCDCFGCAILSHGDVGVVFGTDGAIPLENLILPFKHKDNHTLRGKPKIFIMQVSKGKKQDEYSKLQADADVPNEDKIYRIPIEADFLYVYSTVEGSCFIEALCKMVKKYAYEKDFVDILTHVNYEVANAFETTPEDESKEGKRQLPFFVSMLTKDIFFNKKK